MKTNQCNAPHDRRKENSLIWKEAEKTRYFRTQYPFMIKILSKLGAEGNFLNLIEHSLKTYSKPSFSWGCATVRSDERVARAVLLTPKKKKKKKTYSRDFPGGPVVRTWRFHFGGPGSIPGLGSRIPQDVGRGRKKKKDLQQVL